MMAFKGNASFCGECDILSSVPQPDMALCCWYWRWCSTHGVLNWHRIQPSPVGTESRHSLPSRWWGGSDLKLSGVTLPLLLCLETCGFPLYPLVFPCLHLPFWALSCRSQPPVRPYTPPPHPLTPCFSGLQMAPRSAVFLLVQGKMNLGER